MIIDTTTGVMYLNPNLYKKIFDGCYKQQRFDEYSSWISVGMAIKNTFDDKQGIDLFNYFSSKGDNYGGYEKTACKYQTFKRTENGYTVATIYYYAIEDNKPKFLELMSKNTFELGQTDFCQYLQMIAGKKFVYKTCGEHYKLFCYNGKYWQNDDIIMKKVISNELYNFLKMILIEIYWNTKEFNVLKSKIDKLKLTSMKKDIVETYKEYGVNNDIKFDDKWYLFGFTNLVYDLNTYEFRDYKYDDYISITSGYAWREPTDEELDVMNELINKIMPNKDEKELYLQILATGLEGKCLEKFIIFNGCGGNGKSLMDDMMLCCLGEYALIGNNAILFESSKTGSNPEKAKIHKKRFVIFREPPEKNKFENSIVKELTGGGKFSARLNHDNETEKELNSTMIIECNKRPLFSEDPTEADTRRIIDLHFRSMFTTDKNIIDEKNNIYEAVLTYKEKEFQEKHKYALFKILIDAHKRYKENGSVLSVPKNISERTSQYLELSCNIIQWFKENYELSNDGNVLKLKDIFADFIDNDFYYNLTKAEKRK